ncbi:MAG: cation-translocating P-type ATPase [Anaerolineae bacterium]|nr:cation-translocating P-type ATPase [Anaerolineae bacterium]
MIATPTTSKQDQAAPGEHWHTLSVEAVLKETGVDINQGLSPAEVKKRLELYKPNELVEKPLKSPWAILWEQLTNPLVLLLIGAAGVSALLGKADNVIAIMLIVVINAALGVVQEYRAEQAMAALKKMAAPLVRVRRDNRVEDIQSRDLVPGDVVLLEAGSIVPADARVVESANLRVQEASLTGESQPVDKSIDILTDRKAPLGDRFNMLYMGTSVTYGRGTAVVVQTGMTTQLGRIAELIQSVEGEKTPLQRRMDELGRVLFQAALVVMAIAFVVGMVTGDELQEVLLNAVAIAVAVVPEGLPAVVTIALALGAQRMLRRNALIRKLPAVETLGSVTTICSDKTGTLTANRMTVTVIDVAGNTSKVSEMSNAGANSLISTNGTGLNSPKTAQALVLIGDTLCNDAVLQENDQDKSKLDAIGDPTEGAMVVVSAQFGINKNKVDKLFERVGEVPFDSGRKRMTTAHHLDSTLLRTEEDQYLGRLLGVGQTEYVAFTKGAVDSLLAVSEYAFMDGKVVPLTPDLRQRVEQQDDYHARNGLRVLGLAYRPFDVLPKTWTPETVEHSMIFVGMVGIIDPPRKEVFDAVAICKQAQIRPVMITGDHPLTALAIAKELGITDEKGKVLTGHELNEMSEAQLENVVGEVSVYARVSPEHKLNIVQALQRKGQIAAMTGDGVNDAPALKRSDIGVAMGITGTAVSKEASDMVLLDDNFATIVSATEEGRTIYDNIRRFVKYLLASNTGELFVLLATQLISGMTIPLTTLQILWMNVITDGVPALALGVERAEKGVMRRAPYAPNESLFGRGLARHILLVGFLLGGTGLALGYWAWSNNITAANGDPAWNTMVFFFLTVAQMGHALALRSHRESTFTLNLFSNRLLLGAIVFTVIVQLGAIYLPFFNQLFNTNPLTAEQLLICAVLSTVVFVGVEIEKLLIRRGVFKQG